MISQSRPTGRRERQSAPFSDINKSEGRALRSPEIKHHRLDTVRRAKRSTRCGELNAADAESSLRAVTRLADLLGRELADERDHRAFIVIGPVHEVELVGDNREPEDSPYRQHD